MVFFARKERKSTAEHGDSKTDVNVKYGRSKMIDQKIKDCPRELGRYDGSAFNNELRKGSTAPVVWATQTES